jgi:hypothetical protein
MIESSEGMIGEQNNNLIVNEHLKSQIKTLQNAPRRYADNKSESLLKAKEEREKNPQQVIRTEDTPTLHFYL